jgi:hypothetical protein
MATGGGVDAVLSPEATVQSALLYASKISNRLFPESSTAGPLFIITRPFGPSKVLAVAVEGAGFTIAAKRLAAISLENGGVKTRRRLA